MKKWLIKGLGMSLLSALLFVSGATFGNYEVKASQKRTYHSDMTLPNGMQQLLNQRASEGWRFVALSEGNQDGNTVLVVVFDKE
ncbi:MAG TPA: hypothetical protein VGJ33_11935 [Candidatus Angelobacter sp.]|jgi:hypothetical protein